MKRKQKIVHICYGNGNVMKLEEREVGCLGGVDISWKLLDEGGVGGLGKVGEVTKG